MADEFPLSPAAKKYLPYLVAAAFFMQMLDATILNTALPTIARSFGTDPLQLHSVVISYVLTVAVLIPASGWMSDWLGSRKVFIGAMALFAFGSLLCALSMSVHMLVISRIVQGMGGAFLMPVGRLVILRAYPRTEFVKVMSLVTIPALLGPLMGPLVGGIFVQYLSWHWIFLINIPVGIAGIWMATRYMPDLYAVVKERFDISGFLLFSSAALLFSLSFEGGEGMNPPRSRLIVLAVCGALCLFVYWLHARKTAAPLFSMKLFETTTFAVGIVGNLVARVGGGAMPYLMPLFLQVVLGYSAFKSGLSLLPLAAFGIVGKTLVNPILLRFGYRSVMITNTLLIGGIIISFSLINGEISGWWLVLLLSGLGLVNSMQFTCMNTLTLVDLPEEYASSGNSLLSVVMQFAISLSIAFATVLLNEFMSKEATDSIEVTQKAFHSTFMIIGLIVILSSFVFAQIPRGKGRKDQSIKTVVSPS